MNFEKNNIVFHTTTDNRTYNICSFAQSGDCCIRCRIRHRQVYYHIREYDDKIFTKFPNWKLVSKNRKQWMKKPLKKIPSKNNGYRGVNYTTIKW